MNGVNKWKDELAAAIRERNRLITERDTLKKELKLMRDVCDRLTERIRELEAAPKFDINSIFGGVVNGKP